ncbi:MAG: DoxX family membrane protein [Sphingobacteriales bacterium]|nr:MAG: DoxX family membrane protein [Sphingobacteriales bacterium]
MHLIKEFFSHSIRIMLGLLFIASGLLKLIPIEPFELNFIDVGVANWFTAPIIARGLIGFELLLGLFLIFNLAMNKFTIKATYAILIFFTFYLFYQLMKVGNNGNCGCFGTYLQMTPLESIFKNIAMLSLLVVIQLIPARWSLFWPKFFIPFFILAAFVSPYILNPPDSLIAGHRAGAVNYPLGLKRIYSDTSIIKPAIDLTTGKHIVAFMSLSCGHCRMNALKMHVLQQRNPDFPFYILLNGDTAMFEKSFFDFTKAENIPFSYFNNDDFFSYVDGSVPAIFWLQNDTVKFRSLYTDLNEDDIKTWLNTGAVPSTNDTIRKTPSVQTDTLK